MLRTLLGLALLPLLSTPAAAQPVPAASPLQTLQSPAEKFRVPSKLPEEAEPPERILPKIPPRPAPDRLDSGRGVYIEAFRFEGNTVFDDSDLAALLTAYTRRKLSTQDLQQARDVLTRHYIDQGYVTSGAVIPDQDVTSGIVTLRLIEGRLFAVRTAGTRFFHPLYFEQRLMLGSDDPLQIQDLERRLQIFQEDRRIRRIAAQLDPGDARGEAVLKLRIDEGAPLRTFAEWNNETPTNLGEQTGRFGVGFSNVVGFGDEVTALLRITPGLEDYEFGYGIPVTPWDTEIRARYRQSAGEIVEGRLTAGGVLFESSAWTATIGLMQPVVRTRNTTVRVGLIGEWRRSGTKIDGSGFGFPGTGADAESGVSKIGVVRGTGDWRYRTRTRVFAMRQILSVGVPVWDASENPDKVPDSDFVSSFTQLRAAFRLPERGNLEVVTRTDVQVTDRPLMPLEQIGAGGIDTVRGYGTNEIVRDQAVISSVELRAPLLRSPGAKTTLQLAPFIDFAYAWNHKRQSIDSRQGRTLVSLGLGLRYRIADVLRAELYWGSGRRADDNDALVGVQKQGVHFRVRADLP